ncbi:MAG: hypothetical protein FWH38_02935 [Treponema sp.]|nr:hypothetical protein [Treponema sp.]
MDIKEYKCPNCGGTVNFDSSVQKLKCPSCDTEFEIEALEEYQKDSSAPQGDTFNWNTGTAGTAWDGSELDDLSSGSCPSCGAELIGDKNTIAMVCPCCGNAQIVQKRISGLLKPNYCMPFQLDKKAAVKALKAFCKKKRLLPNFFLTENHINSIQGMYAPFWLFDAKASAHITYRASRIGRVWGDSNYIYTQTDHYSVVRSGSLDFEKVPVDGSEKLDDAYMDAIEPFDYNQIKDYTSAYLAGYSAEKYDVSAEKSKERASARIKQSIEMEFARSVTGFTTVSVQSSSVEVGNGKVSYAMIPLWILNTKYRKKSYQFIMNGQTGRLVGRLPVDRGKAWKYRFMFLFGIGAALTVIISLLRVFI